MLIIRDIIFENKSSYGDFLSSDEKIATNILANRLASLENNGLLKKFRNPANKTKYVYVLTEMAIDLIPLFVEMILWSGKHTPLPIPENRVADLERARTDKEAFAQEIRKRAKEHLATLTQQAAARPA